MKTLHETRKNFYSYDIIQKIEQNVSLTNIYRMQDFQEVQESKLEALNAKINKGFCDLQEDYKAKIDSVLEKVNQI